MVAWDLKSPPADGKLALLYIGAMQKESEVGRNWAEKGWDTGMRSEQGRARLCAVFRDLPQEMGPLREPSSSPRCFSKKAMSKMETRVRTCIFGGQRLPQLADQFTIVHTHQFKSSWNTVWNEGETETAYQFWEHPSPFKNRQQFIRPTSTIPARYEP